MGRQLYILGYWILVPILNTVCYLIPFNVTFATENNKETNHNARLCESGTIYAAFFSSPFYF